MSDFVDFLKLLVEVDSKNISVLHITFAVIVTLIIYAISFILKKFVQKLDIAFSISDFIISCGVAFVAEFALIWLYGPKVFILSIVVGCVTAIYVRNKVFSFIDTSAVADHDLKMRMELAELKTKFKNNPYYSILEVLLYYGYISNIQKETVESDNIFDTPDEMAKEFLHMPILTEEQLDEAIGIMNVIRREGKILTREEALLLLMQINKDEDIHKKDSTVTTSEIDDIIKSNNGHNFVAKN